MLPKYQALDLDVVSSLQYQWNSRNLLTSNACSLAGPILTSTVPVHLFQNANGNPPNSQNLKDMNMSATEVPLLASKDSVYEVFGDTVTERPTVYYNICQV